MTRLLFIFAILAGFFTVAPARAEEQLPSFRLPSVITPQDVEGLSVDFDDAFGMIENPYLSDTIKINYQISLLTKVIERQTVLEQIRDSYTSMGMDFKMPAPPRGICVQLPTNAPCLEAYPDLYASQTSGRKEYYNELQAKADAAIAAAIAAAEAANRSGKAPERKANENDEQARARMKREEEAREAAAAARERKDRYRWSEVSCLSGQCHGILVKPQDAGYRITVRPGNRLPDGTMVQQVSSNGVRVSIQGDVIDLRPAPGDTSDTQNARSNAGNSAMANALENSGVTATEEEPTVPLNVGVGGSGVPSSSTPSVVGTTAAGQAAAQVVSNANAEGGTLPAATGSGGSGQTTNQAPLGPSGLF